MYDNLMELRTLRAEEKAIKARINEIAGAAAQEAVDILAAENRDRGQFTTPDGSTFQLQRTDVFDFTDYNKYKGEDPILWRKTLSEKQGLQEQVKACTTKMDGLLKSWQAKHKDWEPDEVQLTVKVVSE
ncbi:MAG: hypothetical protein IJS92_07960 [Paludibacteraceae bacterium]|nr:hypothetical protein [Paludibacteraceae bacterium]